MLILKGLPLLIAKISNNRLVPEDFENREIWQKPTGGFAPLWMRRLANGETKFWLPEDDIPAVLPTHTRGGKETENSSSDGKMAEEDVPPPFHAPPLPGVHRHTDEGPHDGKDVV